MCVLIWIAILGGSNAYTQHTIILYKIKQYIIHAMYIVKLSPLASWPGAMINPQWLELPMFRTDFCGLKLFEPLKFDCTQITLRIRTASIGIGDTALLSREVTLSELFCAPSEKRSTLKGKNLFPLWINSFLLE